jgi:hypothetical protein
VDNGEDAAPPPTNGKTPDDPRRRRETLDADWVIPGGGKGEGEGPASWPLDDDSDDIDDDSARPAVNGSTRVPGENGQGRPRGAGEARGGFWGDATGQEREENKEGPREGQSQEEWERIRAEIEDDWGGGGNTWQGSGVLLIPCSPNRGLLLPVM